MKAPYSGCEVIVAGTLAGSRCRKERNGEDVETRYARSSQKSRGIFVRSKRLKSDYSRKADVMQTPLPLLTRPSVIVSSAYNILRPAKLYRLVT